MRRNVIHAAAEDAEQDAQLAAEVTTVSLTSLRKDCQGKLAARHRDSCKFKSCRLRFREGLRRLLAKLCSVYIGRLHSMLARRGKKDCPRAKYHSAWEVRKGGRLEVDSIR